MWRGLQACYFDLIVLCHALDHLGLFSSTLVQTWIGLTLSRDFVLLQQKSSVKLALISKEYKGKKPSRKTNSSVLHFETQRELTLKC